MHLWTLSADFRQRMAGWLSTDGEGPIVPIRVEQPEDTQTLSAELLKGGFLVGAIRPPTVPHGSSRLRICMTAGCDESEVERLGQLLEPMTAGRDRS